MAIPAYDPGDERRRRASRRPDLLGGAEEDVLERGVALEAGVLRPGLVERPREQAPPLVAG